MSDQRVIRLASGLTVATERVPGALSVATGVWVGVGARDETPALSGVSHFLEHLLFKGTADRSAQDISRSIDRVGGDINAFTSKEYTGYYCRVPARHQQLSVELLGDVLTCPALRDADVDTERQVILEELAMDDDDPDDRAHRALVERLFPDHPLGRETAGLRETVEAIRPDDVREFFEARYRSASMVVSLAGPIDHDDAVASVELAFAGVREGTGGVPRVAPGHPGAGVQLDDDTEQVHIVLGGRALSRGDDDREALDVVNHVLGGGLSSRLFEEIRERRGLVYTVYSGVSSYDDAGSYTVYAGTQPQHADEVLELVRTELGRLRVDGIDDDELAIAKGYLTGAFELGLEDTGSKMARTATLLVTTGEVRPVVEQVARWQRVEHGDVRRVIERVFADEPVVVTVGPAADHSR